MLPLSRGRIAEEVRQVGEAPTFWSGAIPSLPKSLTASLRVAAGFYPAVFLAA